MQATAAAASDPRSTLKKQADDIFAGVNAAAARGETSFAIGLPDTRIKNALQTAGYTLEEVPHPSGVSEFICKW